MPPRKSLSPKPRGPPRTPPELRSLKLSISFRADQKAHLDRLKADHRLSLLCQQAVDLDAELEEKNADLEARLGHEQVVTMQNREAQLQGYIRDLEAQVAALKEIAVEGWAVAEFGGEQEGQDYHLYFREWNIDRESYRKEARELLQAEHPEAFR